MKLKKFKYLLSIGATALAIAPIASLTINATNNAVVKTNVVNNAEEGGGESTTTPSIPLTAPTTVDATTLSPAGNDLYNDYNYESGYVVKDVATGTISFYNWFKQKMWDFSVTNNDSLPNLKGKTLQTMNIRGALKTDSTYDTKLFVYGNVGDASSTTTSGSYVFEIDMTTGSLVENSLVENETGTTTTDGNSSTLIGDVQQLTVIDANTVIVSSDISNTTNNGHSFNVSVLTFNGNSVSEGETESATSAAPTVTTMTNDLGTFSLTFGEVLGVIKKDDKYLFAFSGASAISTNGSNNFNLNIYYFYFKQNTGTTTTLTQTNFTETSAMTNSQPSAIDQISANNAKPFDIETILIMYQVLKLVLVLVHKQISKIG